MLTFSNKLNGLGIVSICSPTLQPAAKSYRRNSGVDPVRRTEVPINKRRGGATYQYNAPWAPYRHGPGGSSRCICEVRGQGTRGIDESESGRGIMFIH